MQKFDFHNTANIMLKKNKHGVANQSGKFSIGRSENYIYITENILIQSENKISSDSSEKEEF